MEGQEGPNPEKMYVNISRVLKNCFQIKTIWIEKKFSEGTLGQFWSNLRAKWKNSRAIALIVEQMEDI